MPEEKGDGIMNSRIANPLIILQEQVNFLVNVD